jgi:glycosyltransferase involved in cell wall biosynthesis
MLITGILQVRNEETSGHLARFLQWNLPILDHLVAYDDASTDETASLLLRHGVTLIKGDFHAFNSELHIKQELLSSAVSSYPKTDWFLWLDADELLLESRENLELMLAQSSNLGFDGISLPLVNLWRSQNKYRLDSGFNDVSNIRFWKNTGYLRFRTKPGLHHLMHPIGLKKIRQMQSPRILHFGFVSDSHILNKFHVYQQSGQRGKNLWRLVSESGLLLQEISSISNCLGSRYQEFAKASYVIENRCDSDTLLEKCRMPPNPKFASSPLVTLISLIYAGVDWLEFQFGELLKLQQEVGANVVEILFVANDASEDVINFLDRNAIPYVCAPGRSDVNEWYINSVYRAYNYGVRCAKGEYVVLTNSDMAYSPGFLIQLMKNRSSHTYLVAKLVESGRLTPAKSAIRKNFGKKLTEFKRHKFLKFAERQVRAGSSLGGLFMPVIVSREHFLSAGAYPEGNVPLQSLDSYVKTGYCEAALKGEPVIPGDFAFVKRLESLGWMHRTLNSAIAYHFQEGEKSESEASSQLRVPSGIYLDRVNTPLLHGIERFTGKEEVDSFRLRVSDKLQFHDLSDGLVVDDPQDVCPTTMAYGGNVQFCITSSEKIVRMFAIGLDIHTYYLEKWSPQTAKDLGRLVEQILIQELHNTFIPSDPESFKKKISKLLPPTIKPIIKSLFRRNRRF